ncbi:MAG: hypothetical protein B7Y25_06330 [Alphaproteobacteria bacterium 16-39-46]|nr:MAG: hypothetical protein B7Y25_06330 [Alphaproteobacteria bacterium 16-39-46]OZA42320.1 MAG: hypothetical protein B7X84_06400 [Alphaproteobacteria bacterium 17-39-52]HQS84528.1 DUF1778 domain-containing protein [Alphaproteobacteria bacterium]HQS94321.1 DUF1778 domain-containing protein [Alphaproteobacteria bacterium]
MPRTAIKESSRMSLRIRPDDKSILMRSANLENRSLTDFVLHTVLRHAKTIINHAEVIPLSERDSLRVLNLLENPPLPNEKLLAAAQSLRIKT